MSLFFSQSWRGFTALALLLAIIPNIHAQQASTAPERWTEAQANAWYAQQPWPMGAVFLPSSAKTART